jgi:hypothetical protein
MDHGGKRAGAGRPVGAKNKASNTEYFGITEMAKNFGERAIKALLDIAENSESDSARVSAAVALLNRGYGRPRQASESSENMVSRPTVIQLVGVRPDQ